MSDGKHSRPCHILGISAFFHDSAACLLRDGEIIAAVSEDRLTRIKADASFPINAVEYCLQHAGIEVEDLDYIGFYDKPLLKFERILETYLGVVPRGFRSFLMAGPLWIKEKLFMEREIRDPSGTRDRSSSASTTSRMQRARSSHPRSRRQRSSPWMGSASGRRRRWV
jgi:carbamoyltransferase